MTIKKQLDWYCINKLSSRLCPPVGLYAHNNDYRFDFMMTNKIKYSVIYDPNAYKTKHIFIQKKGVFTQRGVDSTQADFYVIVVDNDAPKTYKSIKSYDFYLISLNKLKQLIEKKLFTSFYKFCISSGYKFELDVIKSNSALL